MAHPKDNEIYPIGTVVRLKKTGQFARITHQDFQFQGRGFLNYRGIIEGKGDGHYALYHDEIELEALPPTSPPSESV